MDALGEQTSPDGETHRWSLENDPRDIERYVAEFYERWEFRQVGVRVFILGSDAQTDHIMARPVPRAGPPGPA